jgi:Holliday junction resolvase RusA-like endonuclease
MVLPKRLVLPEEPFFIHFVFCFSNKASDIDNPTKLVLDILQKKYGFNDSIIYKLVIEKRIVKKGQECFMFEIMNYNIKL